MDKTQDAAPFPSAIVIYGGRTIVNYQHQINSQNTVQSHERTRQLGAEK